MPKRVLNFNPGPAALPLSALELARDELLDFEGTGMSILEHSHRGKHYEAVHAETVSLLRELLGIPDSHQVLFMQGGASMQFALVPMNLLHPGKSADYVVTGVWGEKAFAEAQLLGTAREAANTFDGELYRRVPRQDELSLDPNAAYLHFTTNNTIYGTQFFEYPDSGSVPLIADMSSDIAWRPIDVSKFDLIYAGAQKNIGPAGVTIVIAKKDLIASGRKDIPKIMRYATVAKEDSLHNTIPVFAVYMVRNVLRWLKAEGGTAAMEKRNRKKGDLLYGLIDEMPELYRCPVEKSSRSLMTAVFRLPSEDLEKKFVAEAEKRDMVGLKGHRSVGGIRVSMYNAMDPSGVETLVGFMREFAKANG